MNVLKHIKLELCPPQKQFARYKQVFTRKPRAQHFGAQKIAAVVKPILPKPFDKYFPQHLKCRKQLATFLKKDEEENPYERFLANEIKEEVLNSKMLLIIHQNPVTGYHYYKSKVAFKKEGMTLMRNARETVSMALENTKFIPVLQLFCSHTLLLSSPETNVHAAYSLLKKMPYFILLAGVIEGKMVDRHTLDQLGALPDVNAARAQIAFTLNTPAALLAHNINLYGESLNTDSK